MLCNPIVLQGFQPHPIHTKKKSLIKVSSHFPYNQTKTQNSISRIHSNVRKLNNLLGNEIDECHEPRSLRLIEQWTHNDFVKFWRTYWQIQKFGNESLGILLYGGSSSSSSHSFSFRLLTTFNIKMKGKKWGNFVFRSHICSL